MEFMEILKAIILGIVEGITEWLPISSTGHMILVEEFIQLNLSQAFKEMFFYVIQLGAILAVVVIYFHKLNPFSPSKTKAEKNQTWDILKKVIIGCIPAGVIGLPLNDWADENLLNATVVALALTYLRDLVHRDRKQAQGSRTEHYRFQPINLYEGIPDWSVPSPLDHSGYIALRFFHPGEHRIGYFTLHRDRILLHEHSDHVRNQFFEDHQIRLPLYRT